MLLSVSCGFLKIFLDELHSALPVFLVEQHERVGVVTHQHLHQPTLQVLPHNPGNVEHGGLQEQNKHDPLK